MNFITQSDFEESYRLFDTLKSRLSSICTDEHLIEDALQEAYIKLHETMLSNITDPAAWIFIVAKNYIVNYYRKKTGKTLVNSNLVARKTTPQINQRVADIQDDIRTALKEVSEDNRMTLIAQYFLGLTGQQIGWIFSVSQEAANMRCTRARQELERVLSTTLDAADASSL